MYLGLYLYVYIFYITPISYLGYPYIPFKGLYVPIIHILYVVYIIEGINNMSGRPQTANPSRRIEELSNPKNRKYPQTQQLNPLYVLDTRYKEEADKKGFYKRPATALPRPASGTSRLGTALPRPASGTSRKQLEYKQPLATASPKDANVAVSKAHSPKAIQHHQHQLPPHPHDENLGFYNFTKETTVYCFSDIESNMPDEIKDLMFDSSSSGNIEYTPLNLTAANKAIVFTGDLIDRGAYTVRNLLNMLRLKTENAENVILICGNRDINKIRMYHECYIEDIDEKILKKGSELETVEDIIRVLKGIENDDIFENSGCEISASINIQGIVNPTTVPLKYRKKYDKNFKLSYHDDISRITDIYTKTLGALNQIKFFNDEFNVLFGKNDRTDLFGFTIADFNEKVQDQFKDGIEDDPKYILLLKFIAMMNMVMGKNRNKDDLAKLPKCLQPYNGLYIKYLEKCHIISKFTIEDNVENIYIASHSGIPYKTATAAGFFYIPDDVGIEPASPPEKDNHIENIENINNNFNSFIKRILNDDVKYTDDDFKKYVAMGASCLDTTISNLTSLASPIVSSLGIDKIRNESLSSLDTLNIAGAKKIYNIFGHQPSGFTPQINRVSDGGDVLTSYHIDLDVSKAENAAGISNKKSFVYLTLDNKDNNMLVGKVDKEASATGATHYNLKVINNTSDNLTLEKTEEKGAISFDYDISLDEYCKTKIRRDILYGKNKDVPIYKKTPVHMFLVDGYYYGMFGYDLIKLKESLLNTATSLVSQDGAGKKKIYAKSVKRFMNGKRQMVIYLGKRGGEYLKVKGEYISLAKYIKTVNKKK